MRRMRSGIRGTRRTGSTAGSSTRVSTTAGRRGKGLPPVQAAALSFGNLTGRYLKRLAGIGPNRELATARPDGAVYGFSVSWARGHHLPIEADEPSRILPAAVSRVRE